MGFGGSTAYRRTAVTRDVVDEPLVTTRRGVVRERQVVRDEEIL